MLDSPSDRNCYFPAETEMPFFDISGGGGGEDARGWPPILFMKEADVCIRTLI